MRKISALFALLFAAGTYGQSNIGGGGTGSGSTSLPASIQSALVVRYDHAEGSGTTLGDTSGKGLTATLGSGGNLPTWGALPAGGLVYGGGQFTSYPASLNDNGANPVVTWVAFLSAQSRNQTVGLAAVVAGNGAGAVSNASGFGIGASGGCLSTGTTIPEGVDEQPGRLQSIASAVNVSGYGIFNGTGTVAVVKGAADVFYINGQATQIAGTGGTLGLQLAGVYQEGGAAAGSGRTQATFFNGTVYLVWGFSRALTAAEVLSVHNVQASVMAQRGVNVSLLNTGATQQLLLVGDSITCESGSQPYWDQNMVLTNPTVISNQGVSGAVASALTGFFPTGTAPQLSPNAGQNIVHFWAGTNDCQNAVPAATTLNNILSYARNVHAANGKIVVATMMSRTGQDTCKNQLNALLRSNASQFDGLPDEGGDPGLGCDGCNTNANFTGDHIHPSPPGNLRIIPISQRAINRAASGNTLTSGNPNVGTGTGFQTPNLVQQNKNSGGTGTPVTIAYTNNVAAGNLLLIQILHADGVTITGVTDTRANTWTALQSEVTIASNSKMQAFFAQNTGAGANTISVAFSGASNFVTLHIYEYTGVAAAALDVKTAVATGNSTTPATVNLTTTATGDLLWAYDSEQGGNVTVWTQGSGYALLQTDTQIAEEAKISGATGTYNASLTTNTSLPWAIGLAAFKALAGDTTYFLQDQDIYSECAPNGTNNIIMQLQSSVGLTGASVTIKNTQNSGSALCTVKPLGAETIDGLSSFIIPNGNTVEFRSELISPAAGGNNWITVKNSRTLGTATNCSSSAAPAVCGASSSGSVVIAAAATTVTVNTTAVTANSQILLQEDDTLGTKLGVTCNTTSLGATKVSTRTAGTSFVITTAVAPAANPACLSYTIIN